MTTTTKNYSTAVMLFNENIRAIRVEYEPNAPMDYMFKTVDPDVKEDDLVVIPTSTRHGFTVVKVTAVDVDVDFTDSTKIEWIAGRVDKQGYDTILEEEKQWVDAIKASEKRKLKEEIRKNMLDLYNDDETDISKLAIANIGATPSLPESKKNEEEETD